MYAYLMQIMQVHIMEIYIMQICIMQILAVLTSECWNLHFHLREPEKILWQPDPCT